MLKEVTCSCFWGGGCQSCQAQRESERSKMHECMQTSLFFTNFISISIHCFKKIIKSLNSSFTIIHMKGKKLTMANLFSIYFNDVQVRKTAELSNLSYIWRSHQHHLYPSSVLIGFQIHCLLEPWPFVSVCLRHFCVCLTSCCMCRVIELGFSGMCF